MADNSERLRLKAAKEQRELLAILELAKNPIVELAAGTLFISWLTRTRPNEKESQGLLDRAREFLLGTTSKDTAVAIMLSGLIGVVSLQQIAPALPYMADTVKGLLPDIGV